MGAKILINIELNQFKSVIQEIWRAQGANHIPFEKLRKI